MDIVKKEEIYKGAETLGAERDREGDSRKTHWALDYSGERRLWEKKDAVLRGDSDFWAKV